MELLKDFLDFFLHLDKHLFTLIQEYGTWIYVILFVIIFTETGLVIIPFLPGDSLLFAAGTFCAGVTTNGQHTELNLLIVLILLIIAAILGDALNYYIGKTIGAKVIRCKFRGRQLLNQKHIDQTHDFFNKHGSKAIVIARFVPIVRTFAPFVAGLGSMKYLTFLRFNIIGGLAWVLGLTFLGYFFGNLTFVKENFEIVIFGIIILSLLPMFFEFFKARKKYN